MVKSTRSKALAMKENNRLNYLMKKERKYKTRIRWKAVRITFYILFLFYKSRNKKIDTKSVITIVPNPISVLHFLNNNRMSTEYPYVNSSFSNVMCYNEHINISEESTPNRDLNTFNSCLSILEVVKDVLNSLCKKVCRLVSRRKYATKIKSSFNMLSKIRERARLSYHNNRNKRLKRLIKSFQNYHENIGYSEHKRYRQRNTYQINEYYRKYRCLYSRTTYHQNKSLRKKKIRQMRERYQTNVSMRQNKCQHMRNMYNNNSLLRNKICEQKRNMYRINEMLRKNKCEQIRNSYQNNEFLRIQKCNIARNTYHTNNNIRQQKITSMSCRYQNDEIRTRKLTKLRSKYNLNESVREHKKNKERLEYRILEKRKRKLFYLRQKYRANLIDLQNKAQTLLNQNEEGIGSQNEIEIVQVLREAKRNEMRLYEIMARQIREKYLMQAKKKKRKLTFYEQQFRSFVQQMPKYICNVCHRCMFKPDVIVCNRQKYETKFTEENWLSAQECFSNVYVDQFAFDPCQRIEWICKSCHRVLSKGNIPTRSVLLNNLMGGKLPDEIRNLNDLERHLIAIRLPFMKMISLPKGGQKGCKGPVVCVPSEVQDTVNSLPRPPNKSAFIRLKLKRNLNYRGWYKYQMICPDRVRDALRILQKINQNYNEIEIDDNNYDYFHWDEHLTNITNADCNENTMSTEYDLIMDDNEIFQEKTHEDNDDDDDDTERDPRTKFSIPIDTCLQSNNPEDYVDFEQNIISVAPAEKNRPASLLREKGLEAKAFPHLFPDGKNTYDDNTRPNKIKLSTYINNRLFSADFRYASDPHYIFFLQYLNDIQHASSGISLQLRKSCSKSQFTIQNIINKNTLSNMFKKDLIFKHLLKVRGSPQYWSLTLSDLFAMIRQLGVPTWFCSFSAADARWIDLLHYLADYHKMPRKSKYTWNETNFLLKSNPVMVARIFDRRFRAFMKELILSKCQALGEVSDYFYRVEFQKRGSPHIHMVVWIKNAPKYGENSEEQVVKFIDKYISCEMPEEKKDPILYEIINKVQTHSKLHSKSCKRRNKICRFLFPKPISRQTFIVNEQYKINNYDHDDDDGRKQIEKEIQLKMKDMNMFLKEIEDKNVILNWDHFDEALRHVAWTYEEYEHALKTILPVNTIVLKRSPKDRWVNSYNKKCIVNWDANMDIQYVMNAYACAKYMLSYICKAEKEMSDILKNVHQEAKEKNLSIQEEMKVLSGVYFHHREVCVQEAIYRACSLQLKRASRKVEFIPTDPECFRLSKPLSVILKFATEGEENETDILYSNFMDKYLDRPDIPIFDICLADFVAKFGFINKKIQRKRSEIWPLKTLNFSIYKRQKDAIIRFPQFNLEDDSERFYHNMMRLYLPIRNENDIKTPYEEFYRNGSIKCATGEIISVKKIVLSNKQRYESKISVYLQEAMKDIHNNGVQEDAWGYLCSQAEMEKEEISDNIREQYNDLMDLDNDRNPDIEHLIPEKPTNKKGKEKNMYEIHSTQYNPEKIRHMLKTMTHEQLNIFYYVRDWCLRKNVDANTDSIRLFVTGGAGTGKSHLLKCMFYEAAKILNKIDDGTTNEIRTLICAPTNAAALNMNCNTIHSTFKIGIKNFNISENILNTMRCKLESLVLLFIDEISLIDQSLWRELHTRLGQITQESGSNIYFGNISIVAVGDFYQLPPVKGVPLYLSNNVVDYWQNLFEYAELTICQRTKEIEYYDLANRIRKKKKKDNFSEKDKQLLNTCVRRYKSKIYQDDCLHLFAWNQFVDEHNEKMLLMKCKDIIDIPEKKLHSNQKSNAQKKRKTNMSFVERSLRLAVGARVIIEENIDRDDGLVKGAFGNVIQIVFDINNEKHVKLIRIKFDNPDCGKRHRTICEICRNEKTVCISRFNNPRNEDVTKRNIEQFPLRLGWASTVHKVQGLTVKGVVIDLKKFNQAGQAYTSFTRPTNIDEIFLTDIRDESFFCDERIEHCMINMGKMSYRYVNVDKRSSFRLGFHNVEGLQNHYHDIRNHHWYTTCDIICLNETWLQNDDDYEVDLEDFILLTKNRSQCYTNLNLATRERGGVGMYIRKDIPFEIYNLPIGEVESLTIKTNLLNKTCLITTVYKPPNMNSKTFLHNFQEEIRLMNIEDKQHIIVGDFNENENYMTPIIQQTLTAQGYNNLVNKNTTIKNTSLDCIYCKNIQGREMIQIIPAYFSYHHALMLEIFEENIELEINPQYNNANHNIIDISNPSIFNLDLILNKSNIDNNVDLTNIKNHANNNNNLTKKSCKRKTKNEHTTGKKIRKICTTADSLNTLISSYDTVNPLCYESDEIKILLVDAFNNRETHLLTQGRNVHIFPPVLGTDRVYEDIEVNELYNTLMQFEQYRLADDAYKSINELMLPINLKGTHWVLLIIEYSETKKDRSLFYFDSLGRQIPESITKSLIKLNLIQNKMEIKSNYRQSVQRDQYNCGPWIVVAAIQWLDNKSIDIHELINSNIEDERLKHKVILQNTN